MIFIPFASQETFTDGGIRGNDLNIGNHIREMLPLRGVTDYEIFFVSGPNHQDDLESVGAAVSSALP